MAERARPITATGNSRANPNPPGRIRPRFRLFSEWSRMNSPANGSPPCAKVLGVKTCPLPLGPSSCKLVGQNVSALANPQEGRQRTQRTQREGSTWRTAGLVIPMPARTNRPEWLLPAFGCLPLRFRRPAWFRPIQPARFAPDAGGCRKGEHRGWERIPECLSRGG